MSTRLADMARKHRAATAFVERGWHVCLIGPTRLPLRNCEQCRGESDNPEYVPHRGVEDCPHALDTCHGYKAASANLDHVMRMLERNPDANLGIATGASGLVVIDVDLNRKALPVPEKYAHLEGVSGGDDVFCYVLERYKAPFPPNTLTVATRSGGAHYWWALPAGTVVKSTNDGSFGWLVDVRSSGAYVPAPGTVLRDGGTYRRVSEELDPAPAPQWLLHHLKVTGHMPEPPRPRRTFSFQPRPDADRRGQERLGRLADQLATAPEHAGHAALVAATFSAAHLVADGFVTENDAEAAMYQAGRVRGRADSEIRTAWTTALTKAGTGARR